MIASTITSRLIVVHRPSSPLALFQCIKRQRLRTIATTLAQAYIVSLDDVDLVIALI